MMTTWAEEQMKNAGREARQEGLSFAEAVFKYQAHLTNWKLKQVFAAAWRGDSERE